MSQPPTSAPPQITTIVPTFRRPKLLKRAVESALRQTYPHLRVCVYDNASGDETADVVAALKRDDPRVAYHCHPQNIGALSNFNYGLTHVETPFFSLLSDDDILLPEFYETAMKGFADHPEAAFSATDVIVMNADGTYVGRSNARWKEDCYEPAQGLIAIFENNTRTPTWTGILYRASVVKDVGMLDEETHILVDQDFTLRIAARFPFVLSTVPGAIFVNHPTGFGGKSDQGREWLGWRRIIAKLNSDDRIPLVLRQRVQPYLFRELKDAVLRHGRSSILFKDYANAYSMADLLDRDCDAKALALALRLTAKSCQHLPGVHGALALLVRLRRRARDGRRQAPPAQVERYAHFLTET